MSQNPYPFREIVLEEGARRAFDQAINSVSRFENAFTGLEWFLSRDPEIGERLNESIFGFEVYYHVVDSNHYAGTPIIGAVYTYDDYKVTIYGIYVIPYSLGNP